MGPFDLLYPTPPDRRGREPERNAWIELHNLIVAAGHPDELGEEHVRRIRRQRGVDLSLDFYDERVDLYQRFLDWTLEDGDFVEADRQLLGVLARTLHLGPRDVEGPHQRAFGTAVHAAIADDCLSVDERLLLFTLQHTLGLDPKLADGAFTVMARERLLVTVARVLCDGQLSPEEADEIEHAQTALGVTVPERVETMLTRAASAWRLRNGDLPEVPTGLPLAPTERGHLAANATWREANPDRLAAVFSDPDSREMYAAGDTYHLRVPAACLRGVNREGRVLVTNQRVILDARGRTPDATPFAAIDAPLRFQNGVLLQRRGGRATFIRSDEDAALLRILLRAMGGHEHDRPWAARWRPLYASERDRAFRRVSHVPSGSERFRAALPSIKTRKWSGFGDVLIEGAKLVLQTSTGPKRVSIRSVYGAFSHGRTVWLVRRHAHDWLFEFLNEDEADRFTEVIL